MLDNAMVNLGEDIIW